MCRFILGLMAVMALFILVWVIGGESAFMWSLIVGFVGAGLALLLMPRRGPQHAYENWYRLQALMILLVICSLFAGFMWLVLHSTLTPDEGGMAIGGFALAVSGAAYAYGQLMGPPTGRRGWLRRHYPAVAQAIKRYRKTSDLLEAYTPTLIIEGKRYFLIAYHDRRNPQPVAGFLLLDEGGGRVQDEDLVGRAAKCKSLALETVEYARHQRRAAEILSFGQAKSTLKGVLATLRQQRWRFAEMGAETLADWERVIAIEPAVEVALDASTAIKLLEAEWAAKHGLGRLTQVRYEDVVGLEARITEAKRPLLEYVNDLEEAAASAKRLAERVRKMSVLADQKRVEEGLLALMDLGKGMGEEQSRPYSYVRMSDQQWQAWRDRMAWADEVDARAAPGKAKQQTVK